MKEYRPNRREKEYLQSRIVFDLREQLRVEAARKDRHDTIDELAANLMQREFPGFSIQGEIPFGTTVRV